MSTVYGARDVAVGSSGSRTVNMRLPAYFTDIRIGTGTTVNGHVFEVDGSPGGATETEHLVISKSLTVTNSHVNWTPDTTPAIWGFAWNNGPAINGEVVSVNVQAGAHGVRGRNSRTGAAGLIGGANGYDFYADGSGTNYGPFTGTHDALMLPFDCREAQIGDIVVDKQCLIRNGVSNTLFEVELSGNKTVGRSALGVVCAIKDWEDDVTIAGLYLGSTNDEYLELGEDLVMRKKVRVVNTYHVDYAKLRARAYKILAVNSLGEGQINVCGANGDIEQDDLIVISPIRGKGMKQDDDMVRNYTVARAREGYKFKDPTDVATIACIYLSG